jgi:hypothetical protein
MPFVKDKAKITKAVLGILNPQFTDADFDRAMKTWWKNIRPNGGLGLTIYGAEQFDLADIESFAHPFQGEVSITSWTQDVLKLDRKMPCPYMLMYQKTRLYVVVYDSSISTMIHLTETVEQFINTL